MASSPFASNRRPGRPSFTRVGSVPYHQPSESGGGSGTPRREHTPADHQQESRIAAEAYALATPTSRQSGARPGPAKAQCLVSQQTGHGTSLGIERGLHPLLALQV